MALYFETNTLKTKASSGLSYNEISSYALWAVKYYKGRVRGTGRYDLSVTFQGNQRSMS